MSYNDNQYLAEGLISISNRLLLLSNLIGILIQTAFPDDKEARLAISECFDTMSESERAGRTIK